MGGGPFSSKAHRFMLLLHCSKRRWVVGRGYGMITAEYICCIHGSGALQGGKAESPKRATVRGCTKHQVRLLVCTSLCLESNPLLRVSAERWDGELLEKGRDRACAFCRPLIHGLVFGKL